MSRLTALALAGLLSLGIVAPVVAQGNRPPVPPGREPHMTHCDWHAAAQQWEYSNPSVRGFQMGHVGNHIMIPLPPGAPPTACDGLPPYVPPPVV